MSLTGREKRELFGKAEEKFANRRQLANETKQIGGRRALFNIALLAEHLKDVDAADIMSDDTRQTFAIGILYGNRVIGAVKGVKEGVRYTETVARALGQRLGGTIVPEFTPRPEEGLHAEMAIVRYALETMGGNPKSDAWLLGQSLQVICFGKGVCPDCAGWMNKHFIPHLSMQKSGDGVSISYACGQPSAGGQWKHPRTGAAYGSHTNKKEGAVLDSWQKGHISIPRPI